MKGATSKSPTLRVASSLEDKAIEWTLRDEWLTLALSCLETTFTTRPDGETEAIALGLVHFDFGTESAIRARLTLIQEPPRREHTDRIGWFSIGVVEGRGHDAGYVLAEVFIDDPRGRLLQKLQAAFDSAAASASRFLHASFRHTAFPGRAVDLESVLAELRSKQFVERPITEMALSHQTVLAHAPPASWVWGAQR